MIIRKVIRIFALCLLGLGLLGTSAPVTTAERPQIPYYYSCSGFFINATGHLVTAAHCVPAKGKTLYAQVDGVEYKVTIIDHHKDKDIAIGKIDKATPVYLKIATVLNRSERTYTLGYPIPARKGYSLKITPNTISKYMYDRIALIGGPVCSGNSGGPYIPF